MGPALLISIANPKAIYNEKEFFSGSIAA